MSDAVRMGKRRRSGVLLHPTSLPGSYGCGNLGPAAHRWLDWLRDAGQGIWQVLPLGPTGFGDSPYQSFSAFAGSPYLISFERLLEEGLLHASDLEDYPQVGEGGVDYGLLYRHHFRVLDCAWERFREPGRNTATFEEFCVREARWLESYACFMAIKDHHDGLAWPGWEASWHVCQRIELLPPSLRAKARAYQFQQFLFFSQWEGLREHACANGIELIGDMPLFVAYDSADVWAKRDLFRLDAAGVPEAVAGVPPDYFSPFGQLWGNPLYAWERHERDGFAWWTDRLGHWLKRLDAVRIDHFRGLEAYWEVPKGSADARGGRWVKAPGRALLECWRSEWGQDLCGRLIAEDLGVITREVVELMEAFGLPGMKVFAFAPFGEAQYLDDDGCLRVAAMHPYFPQNFPAHCVAYPGTHDNDTLVGWREGLGGAATATLEMILGDVAQHEPFHLRVLGALMGSQADRVIFCMQDVLGLSASARMNEPGSCGIQNWSWRLTSGQLENAPADWLLEWSLKTFRDSATLTPIHP
jgi:4-alpha-glucanotransferase